MSSLWNTADYLWAFNPASPHIHRIHKIQQGTNNHSVTDTHFLGQGRTIEVRVKGFSLQPKRRLHRHPMSSKFIRIMVGRVTWTIKKVRFHWLVARHTSGNRTKTTMTIKTLSILRKIALTVARFSRYAVDLIPIGKTITAASITRNNRLITTSLVVLDLESKDLGLAKTQKNWAKISAVGRKYWPASFSSSIFGDFFSNDKKHFSFIEKWMTFANKESPNHLACVKTSMNSIILLLELNVNFCFHRKSQGFFVAAQIRENVTSFDREVILFHKRSQYWQKRWHFSYSPWRPPAYINWVPLALTPFEIHWKRRSWKISKTCICQEIFAGRLSKIFSWFSHCFSVTSYACIVDSAVWFVFFFTLLA